MPSLLERCPICGSPGPAGELCSTPDCRQQGVRFARPAPDDPSGPDGIVFDLGSLQAQFADIPDPEDVQLDPAAVPPPPPPPPRRPPPAEAAPPPPPPAAPPPSATQDESWADNWKPPPKRREVEKTLLVAPITDDGDGLPLNKKGKSSQLLMVIMVIASLALLGAVIWLMLNPPAPTQKKKPGSQTLHAPADRLADADASQSRQQRNPTSSSANASASA